MLERGALGRALFRGRAALGRLRLRRRPISRQLAVDGALLVVLLVLVSVERLRGQFGVFLLVGAFVAHLWVARTRPRSMGASPSRQPHGGEPRNQE